METDERRGRRTAFRVAGDLGVDLLVPVGAGDHLVLPATVVAIADNTVTVEMSDGVAALAVATSNRCVLVWGDDGHECCALVRTGRRTDDVLSPTTLELVLEDVRPVSQVEGL